MCGLIVTLNERIGDREIDILRHRGPDGVGRCEFDTPAGPLVMGHCRLAIIDPDPRSGQPMSTSDGRLHIVFNGEIYNYHSLREELMRAGCRFHTSSDTEVLLLGYQKWGAVVLERLIGMFAFAIADLERRVLFLARDQFGIKPLYYARRNNRFACASEMKALLALPFVSRRANPHLVLDFLRDALVEHRPETLFQDIFSLSPAHWATISLETGELRSPCRYWAPPPLRRARSLEGMADDLRRRVDESVKLHSVSDVPIGATLSGGLDSTAIVGSVATQFAAGRRLPTFSFISEDPNVSEERWIDLVSKCYSLEVHKVRATYEDFERDIDKLILAQDIPLQGPSIYAEHKVFELARAGGIKVILGGQGADELFAGYLPYIRLRIHSLLRSGVLGAAWQLSKVYQDRTKIGWGAIAAQQLALVLPAGAVGQLRPSPPWLDRHWVEQASKEGRQVWRPRGCDTLREKLRHDVLEASLPAHLRYEDHNSMMHGVESRVPFVVRDMAELAFDVPEEGLVASDGTTKAIVRLALEDRIPADIRNRRDKIGFAAPDRAWFVRFAPVLSRLLNDAPSRVGPVDTRVLRDAWMAMAQGRRAIDLGLWRVFFFIRWAKLLKVEFNH